MAFVIHIETNPPSKNVSQYILLNSGLWSNLLRKTTIITTNYFPKEEEGACISKNR